MGYVNFLVTKEIAERILLLKDSPSSTVKEYSKVPAYALRFLAREIPEDDSASSLLYDEVISSLKYNFSGKTAVDDAYITKRSFSVDTDDLEKIRSFILKHSKLSRPKASYITKLAVSYTLMCFEKGRTEATTLIAPTIDQLDMISDLVNLFKAASEQDNSDAVEKIIEIQNILSR